MYLSAAICIVIDTLATEIYHDVVRHSHTHTTATCCRWLHALCAAVVSSAGGGGQDEAARCELPTLYIHRVAFPIGPMKHVCVFVCVYVCVCVFVPSGLTVRVATIVVSCVCCLLQWQLRQSSRTHGYG